MLRGRGVRIGAQRQHRLISLTGLRRLIPALHDQALARQGMHIGRIGLERLIEQGIGGGDVAIIMVMVDCDLDGVDQVIHHGPLIQVGCNAADDGLEPRDDPMVAELGQALELTLDDVPSQAVVEREGAEPVSYEI